MVLPVIFLSMAVLLTVFFVCLSAISENSKIHIGVVVPEKGFMERGLHTYGRHESLMCVPGAE